MNETMEIKSLTKVWVRKLTELFLTIIVTYAALLVISIWLCNIDAEKSHFWYNGIWHGLNIQGNIICRLFSDNVLWIAPINHRTEAYTAMFWFFGIGGIFAVMGLIIKLLSMLFFGKMAISNRMMAKALLVAAHVDGMVSEDEIHYFARITKGKFGVDKEELDEIKKEIADGNLTYAMRKSQVPELIKNIAIIIAADGRIAQEEADLIFKVAEQNDFSKEKTAKLIDKYMG